MAVVDMWLLQFLASVKCNFKTLLMYRKQCSYDPMFRTCFYMYMCMYVWMTRCIKEIIHATVTNCGFRLEKNLA